MKSQFRFYVSRLLEFQTRRLLKAHNFKIVGVSGAVGKTTTKLAIATVLGQKYQVLVQQGSFNDEIGLPLACFNLTLPRHIFNPFAWIVRLIKMEAALHRPYPYDVLVIEIGTDAPGEVPHVLTYLRPDVGVVTAVTPEHMEFFGTLDAVAQEELSLVSGSKEAVVSYDDIDAQYRKKYVDHHPHHHYYGLTSAASYRFKLTGTDPLLGTAGIFSKPGHTGSEVTIGLFGKHSARAAVAAYAVGDLLGLSGEQLAAGLQAIRPFYGRMNPLPGRGGSVIIDDTYNASPSAVAAALTTLAELPVPGRRIALLGSMNELGDQSQRYHEEVGAAAAGVDLLITVGEMANRHLGPAAVAAGLDPTRYKTADSNAAATEFLMSLLGPGDVLLAKGSEGGIYLEEAIKPLLANPADASKLVRQSASWQRIKARQLGR